MLSVRAQAFSVENLLRSSPSSECSALDLTAPAASLVNSHNGNIVSEANDSKTTLLSLPVLVTKHLEGQAEIKSTLVQRSLFGERGYSKKREYPCSEKKNSDICSEDVKSPRMCLPLEENEASSLECDIKLKTERKETGQSYETEPSKTYGSVSDDEYEFKPLRSPSQELIPISSVEPKSQNSEPSIYDTNNNNNNDNKMIYYAQNGRGIAHGAPFCKPLTEKNNFHGGLVLTKPQLNGGLDLRNQSQYCIPHRQTQKARIESVFCFNHGDVPCYGHPGILSVNDCHDLGRELLVELIHADLWSSFHSLGTEMIITKSGRRMFPAYKVRFSGLDPNKLYTVKLDFLQPDSRKYRYIYHSSQWVVSGSGDSLQEAPSYVTQEGPISGKDICYQVVSFERLKLTNVESSRAGQVSLVSMQKFQPRVVVEEHAPPSNFKGERFEIIFPQTSFIAVTAYQNQQITTLKIASNPFAKGFRDSGKSRPLLYPPSTPFPIASPWSCLSGVPGIFSSDQKGPTSKESFGIDISALEHLYKLKKIHKSESPLIKPENECVLRGKAFDYLNSGIHGTTLTSVPDIAALYPSSFKQQKSLHSTIYQQHQDYVSYQSQNQQQQQLQQQQQITDEPLVAPVVNTCNAQFNEGSVLQNAAIGNSAFEPPAFYASAFRLPPLFYPLTSHLYNQDGANPARHIDSHRFYLPPSLLPVHNQAYQSISLLSPPLEAICGNRTSEPQRADLCPKAESPDRSSNTPLKSDGSQRMSKQRDSPSVSSILSPYSPEQSPLSLSDSPL